MYGVGGDAAFTAITVATYSTRYVYVFCVLHSERASKKSGGKEGWFVTC